jgi:serine/threonine protein kinase
LVGLTLPNGLQVLEHLGSTREGPLYRAEYPTGREVALLILGADLDSSAPAHPRFRQAAKVRHVNLATVHEIGEVPEGPGYLVLESLAGETLSEVLAERGTLPPDEAVDLFLQAAAGLEAAHRAGLVHANLSPDTILVTRTAGGPLVKLIGFALVSSLPPLLGKPTDRDVRTEYASPERLAGYVPDERSDVFSLGAVLHHLLTGAHPGLGSEGFVSMAMRAAVAKAVLPIPEHRFQTIAEFVAAVKHAADAGTGLHSVAGPSRLRARRPLLLRTGGIIALAASGLWLLAGVPRQGPAGGEPPPGPDAMTSAAGASAEGTETGFASVTPESPDSATDPTDVPDAMENEPASTGATTVAPPAARTEKPARVEVAARAHAGRSDAPPDTSATPAPLPIPASTSLEERAQVGLRIGLDEASRHLGKPAHAIEGMSPVFLGLARGRFPEGADTARPVVRGVYLDPNGALILLDQQRTDSARQAPAAGGIRWTVGDITLYLHGEGRPAMLKNLAKRVR